MGARLESQWTAVAGARIHARVSTSAPTEMPPIVLVHGLGLSSRYMVPTAQLLAEDFHVYTVDLPGFGCSAKPEGALAVGELAAALVAWLTETRLEGSVVVANSFGCQVAAELVIARPDLVHGLVLLAPTVDPDARSIARSALRWLLTVVWERPSLQRVIARDYRDAGLRRVWDTAQFALDDRIETKLARIGAPVLVVRGSRDRVVSQRWAEHAAALAPEGRLTVVRGAPHCLNFSAPEEVAALIATFARRSKPPGASAEDSGPAELETVHTATPPKPITPDSRAAGAPAAGLT